MDLIPITIRQIRLRTAVFIAAIQTVLIVVCYLLWFFGLVTAPNSLITVGIISAVITSTAAAFVFAWYTKKLLTAFGQAVLHVSPSKHEQAPKIEELPIAKEFMTGIVYELYQIASLQDNKIMAEHKREATQAANILQHLPLPVFVFNKQQVITFATDTALNYYNVQSSEVLGKSLFDLVDLEFPSNSTLEQWIIECQKNKAIDTAYWHRVRVRFRDDPDRLKQCDIAGYYNRDNPTGVEFIVTLFDKTAEYNQDDNALNFAALAVHELRNPLTMMRGIIEVFEEELQGKLDGELTRMLYRLRASAQQLTSFVNNILNVAKIEENQLTVKLAEEDWQHIINQAAKDMDMRAKATNKTIEYDIAKNVPVVAADRMSIYEVLTNLIDNAIKYSGDSKEITVRSSVTKDGLIETLVIDKGVGIPTSVIPNLFEKFHRNHRNQAQVGGTGLGLYLSKAIVNAHGGDIWVKSKEGAGTTVGFTLKPYSMLADELKSGNNKDDMVRTAHGWIKNHSLYRR